MKSPSAVGVPLITPLAEICNPPGNPPALHAYGSTPLVAANCIVVYGVPMAPPGNASVVIWNPDCMTSWNVAETAEFEGVVLSVTVTRTWYVPAVVGTPLSAPVVALNDSPGGIPL